MNPFDNSCRVEWSGKILNNCTVVSFYYYYVFCCLLNCSFSLSLTHTLLVDPSTLCVSVNKFHHYQSILSIIIEHLFVYLFNYSGIAMENGIMVGNTIKLSTKYANVNYSGKRGCRGIFDIR